MSSVLFNLREDNLKLRTGIYDFFSKTLIQKLPLFLTLLDRILANLVKFPGTDTELIFGLMQKLGRQHFDLVVSNYHQILGFDQTFLTPEPYQDQPAYIAKLILLYAAAKAKSDGRVLETLDSPPFFLEKHLDYLMDKYE